MWLFIYLLLISGSNALIRAIDLGSDVLSPAFAGYVMTVLSVSVGAAIIAFSNLLSLCVEAALYFRIWRLCPAIHATKEFEEVRKIELASFCILVISSTCLATSTIK